MIFDGSTGLPRHPKSLWKALQHWAELLAKLRQVLPGAKWHVHVEDHELQWDAVAKTYDLQK